jgi:hypothetical protein
MQGTALMLQGAAGARAPVPCITPQGSLMTMARWTAPLPGE